MTCRLVTQNLFGFGLKRYVSYGDETKTVKIIPVSWSLRDNLHLRFVSSGINYRKVYFSNCGNLKGGSGSCIQRIRRFKFDKERNKFHIVDNDKLIKY